LARILSSEALAEINEKFLFFYVANKEDIRRCPNKDCDYAGTILLEKCKDQLVCSK
jgi:hypothetical protein